MEEFSLRQPASAQCFNPAGAPLYPVARILLSFTRIAPTLRLRHVDLFATSLVIAMKYSGQDGLFWSFIICHFPLIIYHLKGVHPLPHLFLPGPPNKPSKLENSSNDK
jgi:hypothetical protein